MTSPRDERGRYKPGVAYAGPVVYQLMGEQIARRRVLDQAVRNVEAQRCMGWWRPPTYIGDDLAAAYRAEFQRLWAEQ